MPVKDLQPASSLGELIERARQAQEARGFRNVWYRGQSQTGRQLIPKLWRSDYYRDLEGRNLRFVEANAYGDFQLIARSRDHKDVQEYVQTPGDWLVLMQHHGMPTRLLDWTESLAVAAFFAVNSTHEDDRDKPGEIWFFDPRQANADEIGAASYVSTDSPRITETIEALMTAPETDESEFDWSLICLISPEFHPRIRIQHARFTLHRDSTPLEELRPVARVEIPPECKSKIREELDILGFRRDHLFPSLDVLAKETARRAGEFLRSWQQDAIEE